MKKKIAYLAVLTAALAAFNFYSCRKATNDALTTEETTQTSDANKVQTESDQSNNDANNSMSTYASLGGRLTPPICDATITAVDSLTTKKITLTYNGSACLPGGRVRTGSITIQLVGGGYWKTKGAQLLITYNAFKVVYPNGKSVQFDGSKTVTNQSGGNYWSLVTNDSTITILESMHNMKVTFETGATATWNSSRISTISYSNLVFSYTTTGDTTVSGNANTVAWGLDRVGNAFTRYLTTAVAGNTSCGLHHPTAGNIYDEVNGSVKLELTLGTDASGNVVSSGCPEYYKVTWTNSKSKTETAILAY